MKTKKSAMSKIIGRVLRDQTGAMAVWFALFIPVFLGVAALAVDLSYGMMMRQKLQVTTSSAALAGAAGLITDTATAKARAKAYADANFLSLNEVLSDNDDDVVVGNWSFTGSPRWTPGGSPTNAVQVTARLDTSNNNPLGLIFAGIAGLNAMDVRTTATAVSVEGDAIEACLIALNPDPNNTGLELSGGTEMNIPGCGVCVNSTKPETNSDGSISANGTPEINAEGGAIVTAGGVRTTGGIDIGDDCSDPSLDICPSPYHSDPDADGMLCNDPYLDAVGDYSAGLTCDPFDNGDGSFDLTKNANGLDFQGSDAAVETDLVHPITGGPVSGKRYQPGVYCTGINIDGGDSIEFAPGIYYVVDPDGYGTGVVSNFMVNGMSGNGRFMATQVVDPDPGSESPRRSLGATFVLSGSKVDFANAIDSAFLTGSRVETDGVAGITVDDDPGFIFYQDPNNPGPTPTDDGLIDNELNGGTDFFIDGTVYFGMQDLVVRGDIASSQTAGSGCLAILAGTIDMAGGPTLNLDASGCGLDSTNLPTNVAIRLVGND